MKWTQQVHKPIDWRCDVDHAAETFKEEEAFRKHLNVEHSEYSVAQQEAIYRSSKVTRRRRRNVCPMCNVDVAAMAAAESMSDNKKPGKLAEFEQLHKLAKHVAGHLRRLAFDSADDLDAEDYEGPEATIATTNGKVCRTGSVGRPPSGAGHLSSVRLDPPERPGMFLWRIVLTRVIYHLRSRHYGWSVVSSPRPEPLLVPLPNHTPYKYDFDVDWSVSALNDLSRRAFLAFDDHASEEQNPSDVLPWSDTIAILKEKMDPKVREEHESGNQKGGPHIVLQHFLLNKLVDESGEEDAQRFWAFAKAYVAHKFPHASEAVADVLLRAALHRRARLLQISRLRNPPKATPADTTLPESTKPIPEQATAHTKVADQNVLKPAVTRKLSTSETAPSIAGPYMHSCYTIYSSTSLYLDHPSLQFETEPTTCPLCHELIEPFGRRIFRSVTTFLSRFKQI
jgi:hypothetical protein